MRIGRRVPSAGFPATAAPGAPLALLVATALLAAAPALAEPVALPAYEELLEGRYHGPVPVPREQVVLEAEGARFYLESGELWLQSLDPGAGGSAVVGLAFRGRGRFALDVPDRRELLQLQRFARDEELERADQRFSRLILYVTAPELVELLRGLAPEAALGGAPVEWVRERLEEWALFLDEDPRSRVVLGLSTFGDRYLWAEMETADFGRVLFEIDPRRREELRLAKVVNANWLSAYPPYVPLMLEEWLRLERPADRAALGGPGDRRGTFSSMRHFAADIDLRRVGRYPRLGFGSSNSVTSEMEVTARFESHHDGLGGLHLHLEPRAVLRSVTDAAGRELAVARFPRGRLAGYLDRSVGSRRVAVVLAEPLERGDMVELRFRYELELANFAPGLSWYPTTAGDRVLPHTADLTFRTRSYYGVRATGVRMEQILGRDGWVERWRVAEPTRMAGFTFARYPHARRYDVEGLPPLTLFGTRGGYLSAERIEELSGLLLPSYRCLGDLFGAPEVPEVVVTLIAAGHAQAFEGFIQVSDSVAMKGPMGVPVAGTKERLMAHELAHLYWGHSVVPNTERDRWLSEAMAEYAAAECVRRTLPDGERIFDGMLDAYTNEVTGTARRGFAAFARPGLAVRNDFARARQAPIGHGNRSATRHNPVAPFTTLYRKGALVLHMIRQRLAWETGDDELFFGTLRELLDRERGAPVTTQVFEELLARRLDLDWEDFFDQWVWRAEVPSWKVATRVEPLDGHGSEVRVEIRQSRVAEPFRSEVPILVELADGSVARRLVTVSGPTTSASLALDGAVKRVTVNPDFAVLARQRR